MIQGVDDRLRLRLDTLEARGRQVLSARGQRRSLMVGLRWAAWASAVGPAILLFAALLVPPSIVAALMALVVFPGLIAIAAWTWTARATVVDRGSALALLDHRFGLKDRIQATDEFERLETRTAFHDAALAEADPWLTRAAEGAVQKGDAPRLTRSWLWFLPAIGVCLIVLAAVVPQVNGVGTAPPFRIAEDGAPAASAPVEFSSPQVVLPDAAATSTAKAAARGSAQAAREGGGRDMAAIIRRLATVFTPRDRAALPSMPVPARPGGAGEASAAGGGLARGAQGLSGKGSAHGASSPESEAGPQQSDPAPAPGEAGAQDDARAEAASGARSEVTGGRQAVPAARPAQPPQSGSENSQNGEGQQPGRSRRSDQSNSGREQGGGQGESGQRSGDDAGAKKGRGISSLLLATPMQDRLAGMVNPGRMSTTTRDGAPRAFDSRPAQAGDRGRARGQAPGSLQRPGSAQEQRLTRDYFTDRNAGAD